MLKDIHYKFISKNIFILRLSLKSLKLVCIHIKIIHIYIFLNLKKISSSNF